MTPRVRRIKAWALFDVRGNIVSDQNKVICISEDRFYLESYGKRHYIGADDVRQVEIHILPTKKRKSK